jgi:hypothetical protein
MQDNTVARPQSTRVQTSLYPSFKCNVLRESLSVDSPNIPCATLKRRRSWVISVYLWIREKETEWGGGGGAVSHWLYNCSQEAQLNFVWGSDRRLSQHDLYCDGSFKGHGLTGCSSRGCSAESSY